MPTQCRQEELDFGSSGGRKLVGAFDGGAITSNGGSVLLAATDKRIGLAERLAGCFIDHRSADRVEHALVDLLRQRIFGIALGHEDLIDHDALRFDPALTAVLGKPGGGLAGKSTLNRLEHAAKIGRDRHLLAALKRRCCRRQRSGGHPHRRANPCALVHHDNRCPRGFGVLSRRPDDVVRGQRCAVRARSCR